MQYSTQNIEKVKLLLEVLPIVMDERCFALHGGTAINFFLLDMPRLSVDIDLTYIPLHERKSSFEKINHSLKTIDNKVKQINSNIKSVHNENRAKLYIKNNLGAEIKVDVNLTNRGIIDPYVERELSPKVKERFSTSFSIPLVPIKQVYGGKICAGLSRQNIRDLFDGYQLLNNIGFNDEIKEGFLFFLLSTKESLSRILDPPLTHLEEKTVKNFQGMTETPFTYKQHKETLQNLISEVNAKLTEQDKEFLISFKAGSPDWSLYDWKDFPGVQWKLQNILILKKDPVLHRKKMDKFISVLNYSKPKPTWY